MSGRKPLLLLLVVAGAVLSGLLLGELLIRLTGAAPEVGFFQAGQFRISANRLIGWEPVPDPEAALAGPGPAWPPSGRNSLGYRDYEHALRKPEGVYRILVIGDSVTKGFMIDRHEGVFPSVMERKLKERGLNVEVMNFGVEGYNTQQEVETLRDRGLAYDPDLVVLAYVLNDRDWPAHHLYRSLLEEEARSGRVSRSRMPALLARSALYRFLRFRVLGALPSVAAEPDRRIEELVDLVQRDTVEEYFGVLEGLSRSAGFQVLVLVFPYLDDLSGSAHAEHHAWVASLARRHGFRHLDLLEAFRSCRDLSAEPLAIDEVHPTYVGHYCAGFEAARYIAAEILGGGQAPAR